MKTDKTNKILGEFEKKDNFEAPEGYFDQLPDAIMQKIIALEDGKNTARKEAKIINFPNIEWILAGSIAAAIALLLVFNPFSEDAAPKKVDYQNLLSGVSNEALIEYLAASDLATTDIIAGLESQNIELNNMDMNLPPMDIDSSEVEGLLEYYTL